MIKIGDKIGEWIVLRTAEPYIAPKGQCSARWTCECSCGAIKMVRESSLLNGDSKGCGCKRNKRASDRMKTHSLSQHPMYSVWYGMQRRCSDSSRKDYKHYGGRGILVCERWSGVDGCSNFIEDMYPTYQAGLEIERINVNEGYYPENCTWVTRREQVINRRAFGSNFDTKFIEYNGENLCLSQWAEKLNIDYRILVDRIGKLGWTVEKAFSEPYKPKSVYIEYGGVSYKTKEFLATPPNVFALAKSNNLSFHQFMANVFIGKIIVKAKFAKEIVIIEPTADLSHLSQKIRLNEQIINEYGVQL